MQRRTVHYSGNVQGVGFRYTVKNLSIQYNVNGYVRNLPDGRVEVVMEGPEGDLEMLALDVKRKLNPFIKQVHQDEMPATGEFDAFAIRH
jgi:acylphosphatase